MKLARPSAVGEKVGGRQLEGIQGPISRKSEARWSGVSGVRRMRAGFLLQQEEERV